LGCSGCDAEQLVDEFEPAPEALTTPARVIDAAADWVGTDLELEGDRHGAGSRHALRVHPGGAASHWMPPSSLLQR
jgi:hypothetical protein